MARPVAALEQLLSGERPPDVPVSMLRFMDVPVRLFPCYDSHHDVSVSMLPCYGSRHFVLVQMLPCYGSRHDVSVKMLPCYRLDEVGSGC